ncbi:hypothetical protein HMPREF1531_01738 [Propionibacterium sp. oral taxon 192 str. F0372]|nr:hypothetical protein HMPREF1531_01738 [Propionibacterium sp. oral taxon 192 str. F0372]
MITGPTLHDTSPVLWPWAGAAVVILGVTLCAPFEMNVFVMGAVGVLHIACALRYLVGRTAEVIPPGGGAVIVAWLTVMALIRLISTQWFTAGHRAEVIASGVVMCLVAHLVCRGTLRWTLTGVMVVVTVLGVIHLGWWIFAAAHIHNLVPVVLVWDWARRSASTTRRMVHGFLAVWALVIPALLIGRLITTWPIPRLLPEEIHTNALISAVAPPGADPVTAMGWYAAFCFMQGMHYLFWIGFTHVEGRNTVSVATTLSPLLSGPVMWMGVAVLTVIVAGLQIWDYPVGRMAYSALGAYNVHYEMAALVVVLSQLVSRHR